MAISTFRRVVTEVDQLREILGHPMEMAVQKQISALDHHCRDFIARSPFLLIGTASGAGVCDVSPKGDPTGFVQVLDDNTLVIPDRPGNRRADTLTNILENPQVGLLFMIPGIEDTLRVNGRAHIVQDEDLLERTAVRGKKPLLAIVVEVEEAFLHCAKAFKRSRLWDPESQAPRGELATLAKMVMDHTGYDACTLDELEEKVEESYKTDLY